ncbi:hypothetical protein HU200_043887 [Digitaria exilis]|uniref:DUF1618 domain-containing protein n=1 Tax=Digitaria exilis TaxID=1010633 RepID=A0A835B2V2_9POAL|nr:hypothetical protein HU200_043887 [Digitaria exilis]
MAIGGPDATMAFVDLWNGILFCDIRKLQQHHHQADNDDDDDDDAIPILSYVPVPNLLDKEHKGDARLWRNIALIGGRLKYVELKRQWDRTYRNVLCQRHRSDEWVPWHRADGWVAVTFSRLASSSMDEGWRQDCYMDSTKTDFSNDPRLHLLPRASSYYDGVTKAPPFKRLHIRQPVLGLMEGEEEAAGADVIFFTVKLGSLSDDAWVVAVDMRNKAILGVDAFSAARVIRVNFAYMHSRISRYLSSSGTTHPPVPSCPDQPTQNETDHKLDGF